MGRASPQKKTRTAQANKMSSGEEQSGSERVADKPTKPRRGRPPGKGQKSKNISNGDPVLSQSGTPKKPKRKNIFSTPSKSQKNAESQNSIPLVRNADRSARRKSARSIVDRTATLGLSEEDDEEEDLLARTIWEADEAGSEDQEDDAEDELAAESSAPNTPSKRKRGRRKKSLTPPQNLPPHERYFWQNRPGKVKTSNNTISSISLLNHEQYHDQITSYSDPHTSSYSFLHSLHSRSFPQWRFEFSQSFNICLYGYGSKRELVTAFATYLHKHSPTPPKILITNGYTPTLTLRVLLTTLAPLVYDCPSTLLPKLPSQPHDLLTTLLTHLTLNPPPHPIHIFINSLDAPPLRRAPSPSLLAVLASHPAINLLATCDTPNYPLLWDVSLRDRYNFLSHDTTTFLPYSPFEIPSSIDSVNELLSRSGRSVKGKEGVGFVLRSLPENARSLYRVLIAEILSAMDEDGAAEAGVEFKVLYQKVVEEFICSNEMGFRQLLKEFWDHDMIVSRMEGMGGGAEVLGVPWRREEMESILEDLVG